MVSIKKLINETIYYNIYLIIIKKIILYHYNYFLIILFSFNAIIITYVIKIKSLETFNVYRFFPLILLKSMIEKHEAPTFGIMSDKI